MTDEIIISAKNLTKKYALYSNKGAQMKAALSLTGKKYHREYIALDDVSFEMRRGDCLAIIGKNGSGKSTLLQIIAGLMKPTHGQVDVLGKVSALVQLGATFNLEFTGLDNVKLYATALGCFPKEIEEKLPEILRFADIGEFVNQKVKTYSSGMRARLAFSVVISLEPEILIVDEVLSVGDMFFKQKCINKLKQMIKEGLTLFFVSHSLHDVKSLCARALYLDKGKVVSYGDMNEVTTLYQHHNTNNTADQLSKRVAQKNKGSKLSKPADIKDSSSGSDVLDKIASHRAGTYELKFTDIMLCDAKKNKTHSILPNEGVEIIATIIANKDVPEGASVGVLIRNQTGYDLLALNSDGENLFLPRLKSGQKLLYSLEVSLPLLPGPYSLNIGIRPSPDSNLFFDRIFNAFPFEIIPPSDFNNQTGILYVRPSKIEATVIC